MISATIILLTSLFTFEIPTCGEKCDKAGGIACLAQKIDIDDDGTNDLAGLLCGIGCKDDSYCNLDEGEECVHFDDFGEQAYCVKLCTDHSDCHAGQFCDDDQVWPEVQGCFWGQG